MSDCKTCGKCYVSIITGDVCVDGKKLNTGDCDGYVDATVDVNAIPDWDIMDDYYEEKHRREDMGLDKYGRPIATKIFV